ncbi:MAG TPA: choice-of-anchor V domain-containing protein, partial [Longimicrobiaceae bacterium]|nr:choice-of-anchor V domain-containing protein [Longimicrobiaceae bacterium]
GEPTCAVCHSGAPLNDSAGTLAVEGIPEAYRPGERYRLAVRLTRADLEAGGFQLAARCGDGRQAGELSPVDTARVRVTTNAKTGVRYAHQTREGTIPAAAGAIEWPVEWTAPARGCRQVRVDVSANAANHDDSALGDYVYARSRVTDLAKRR